MFQSLLNAFNESMAIIFFCMAFVRSYENLILYKQSLIKHLKPVIKVHFIQIVKGWAL